MLATKIATTFVMRIASLIVLAFSGMVTGCVWPIQAIRVADVVAALLWQKLNALTKVIVIIPKKINRQVNTTI